LLELIAISVACGCQGRALEGSVAPVDALVDALVYWSAFRGGSASS
jgi:hypothetical protein